MTMWGGVRDGGVERKIGFLKLGKTVVGHPIFLRTGIAQGGSIRNHRCR